MFLTFEHPEFGLCAIDTGYGPAIRKANRSIAGRFLSTLLPIPKKQLFDAPNYLLDHQRIDFRSVRNVFVSHFHADHIGGLSLFPESRFIYHEESYRRLMNCNFQDRLAHGFLPDLIPDDFIQRGAPLPSAERFSDLGNGLVGYDYFNDGSVIVIDLPGHAIGHVGYLLRTEDSQPILYAVDSFWDGQAWESKWKLPWLARKVAHSAEQYIHTQEKLREFTRDRQTQTLACHCPRTQEHVKRTQN